MPAKKPTTMPIYVQLSESEFNQYILPHLSMPKREPKCKLGYHRLFNLILWVLNTGMQWKCLPVPKGNEGKAQIHYITVYKAFAKWSEQPRALARLRFRRQARRTYLYGLGVYRFPCRTGARGRERLRILRAVEGKHQPICQAVNIVARNWPWSKKMDWYCQTGELRRRCSGRLAFRCALCRAGRL